MVITIIACILGAIIGGLLSGAVVLGAMQKTDGVLIFTPEWDEEETDNENGSQE